MSSEEDRSGGDFASEVKSVITESFMVNQHRSKRVPKVKKLVNGRSRREGMSLYVKRNTVRGKSWIHDGLNDSTADIMNNSHRVFPSNRDMRDNHGTISAPPRATDYQEEGAVMGKHGWEMIGSQLSIELTGTGPTTYGITLLMIPLTVDCGPR